jgi:serine/threonine protein kinase
MFIKANFCLGSKSEKRKLFCIDFGLSKRYRDPQTLQHISYSDGRSLTGTPRYASIKNHLGVELSRRDDLESIGYMLIYFLKGSLPWQGLKAKSHTKKYSMILEKKKQVTVSSLCQELYPEFAEYMVRNINITMKISIFYILYMSY